MSDHNKAQQELRPDLISELSQALVKVRDLVSQLSEPEQHYMMSNSVVYRRLVHTIEAALRVKEALKRG